VPLEELSLESGTEAGQVAANPSSSPVKTVSPTHCRFSFSGSMMNRMSLSETIFLFFLALIIFGPKKLPEIARQVGKYMNEFRRASNEFKAQIEQEISNLEVEKRQTILPPSPPPEGTASRTLSMASSEVLTDGTPTTEAPAVEMPATQASSNEQPSLAAGGETSSPSPIATEAVPHSDELESPASRESHV
jgi:sec-independent protein translocase protein TatB